MKRYFRALTIAGSDSGGGAGIQADLKTFAALGCYGMSVITALTAQNTVGVSGIHPVPPEFVARQIDAVLQDIGADAVKIGMLHSPRIIHTVAERLSFHGVRKIVLDPVMVAKSGDRLLEDEAVGALKRSLIPMAALITPNLSEAAILLGREVAGITQMQEACKALAELGSAAVLLKGGHLGTERSSDVLYIREDDVVRVLETPRIDTGNTHGTGCTLSSAIAAYLARGFQLDQAVRRAKAYLTDALKAGAEYHLGHGHGPLHHFYAFWD